MPRTHPDTRGICLRAGALAYLSKDADKSYIACTLHSGLPLLGQILG